MTSNCAPVEMVQRGMVLVVLFFFFEILIFFFALLCLAVAMRVLVHDREAFFSLP